VDNSQLSAIQQMYSDVSALWGALMQCERLMMRINWQRIAAGQAPLFTAAKIDALVAERERMSGVAGKLRDAMPGVADVAL